ncbi:MAG: hypothetical protein ACI4DN_05285 [Lachnospiraceae bacterium]
MAFGIGINAQKADGGVVKGIQREVACECWFTSSGKVTPLMIKVQDEDGEIRVIRQIVVHSQEKKMYAGIPSIEFNCTLTILEQTIPAKLIYYQTESRWVLNYTS